MMRIKLFCSTFAVLDGLMFNALSVLHFTILSPPRFFQSTLLALLSYDGLYLYSAGQKGVLVLGKLFVHVMF